MLPVELTICTFCGSFAPCYIGQDDLGSGAAWCVVGGCEDDDDQY